LAPHSSCAPCDDVQVEYWGGAKETRVHQLRVRRHPLYPYGHKCVRCDLHSGTFTQYVKMGPFTEGYILTSVDGTARARCKTR
jgi:hypothetical protein